MIQSLPPSGVQGKVWDGLSVKNGVQGVEVRRGEGGGRRRCGCKCISFQHEREEGGVRRERQTDTERERVSYLIAILWTTICSAGEELTGGRIGGGGGGGTASPGLFQQSEMSRTCALHF